MFGNISNSEILLVGLVIFLLFGGKKLPELTKGILDSIRQFRSSFKEGEDSTEEKK